MTNTWNPKHELDVLSETWESCTRCELENATESMIGTGKPDAEILVVGGAPNVFDEYAGVPFSGEEGDLLRAMLKGSNMVTRTTYFTTAVGCRIYRILDATEDNDAQELDYNPPASVIKTCAPRLHDIIYAVDPKLIITVGQTAWSAVVKDREGYTTSDKAAGRLFVAKIPGRSLETITYPVLVLPELQKMLANPSTAKHAPTSVALRALTNAHHYLNTLETP